jgi:hypothetical protein
VDKEQKSGTRLTIFATDTGEGAQAVTKCFCNGGVRVSSLLSVSLFKFITWDRSQLVGLSISLRYIAKSSYARHCRNTNVTGHAQRQKKTIFRGRPRPQLTTSNRAKREFFFAFGQRRIRKIADNDFFSFYAENFAHAGHNLASKTILLDFGLKIHFRFIDLD